MYYFPELIALNDEYYNNQFVIFVKKGDNPLIKECSPIKANKMTNELLDNNLNYINLLNVYTKVLKLDGTEFSIKAVHPKNATTQAPRNVFLSVNESFNPNICMLVSEMLVEGNLEDYIPILCSLTIPKDKPHKYINSFLEGKDGNKVKLSFNKILVTNNTLENDFDLSSFTTLCGFDTNEFVLDLIKRVVRLKKNVTSWGNLCDLKKDSDSDD